MKSSYTIVALFSCMIAAQAQEITRQPQLRLAQMPGLNIPGIPGLSDPVKECTSSGAWENIIKVCSEVMERKLTFNNYELSKIYFSRGIAFVQTKRLNDAISDFSESIKLDPSTQSNGHAYYNRAIVYIAKGVKQQAIADLRKILSQHPNHKPALDTLKSIVGK